MYEPNTSNSGAAGIIIIRGSARPVQGVTSGDLEDVADVPWVDN